MNKFRKCEPGSFDTVLWASVDMTSALESWTICKTNSCN